MPAKPDAPTSVADIIGGIVDDDAALDDRSNNPVEARKKAMDLLARREHARGELMDKLAKAGFERDAAAEALDSLAADGLQSDARFVENFVQSRVNQGKGPVRIRADLGQRGVRGESVQLALDAVSVDWRELARDVRQKKFGTSAPGDFKERARQMRFLQYRGFEPDQIQAAVGDD